MQSTRRNVRRKDIKTQGSSGKMYEMIAVIEDVEKKKCLCTVGRDACPWKSTVEVPQEI